MTLVLPNASRGSSGRRAADRARAQELAREQLARDGRVCLRTIATEVKRPYHAVYRWARSPDWPAGGWVPRPPAGTPRPAVARPRGPSRTRAAAAAEEQFLLRRCETCAAVTRSEACPNGHAMPRPPHSTEG